MKKKTLTYSIVILLIFSALGYYTYQHAVEMGVAKPALVLRVSTNMTERDTPMIKNVTFEQSGVPFFFKRTDTAPDFPEIVTNARINKLDAAPATFWASTRYDANKAEGVYTLTLLFRDGNEPEPGDVLIMPIEIKAFDGARMYKSTALYEWK